MIFVVIFRVVALSVLECRRCCWRDVLMDSYGWDSGVLPIRWQSVYCNHMDLSSVMDGESGAYPFSFLFFCLLLCFCFVLVGFDLGGEIKRVVCFME